MAATPPLDLAIRVCEAHDLHLLAALWSETHPETALTAEELRHERAVAPAVWRQLAWVDGEPVGAAICAPVASRPEDYPGAFVTVMVREEHRGRGIGSGLLKLAGARARAMGKSALYGVVPADRPASLRFLGHRGFVEWDRSHYAALDLRGVRVPRPLPPAGVRLTTLADDPLLARGMHELAVETYPAIPATEPPDVLPYPQWRAHALDTPQTPPEACVIAVEGRRVVGWANLELQGARPGVAYHAMTVVRASWRGRGVARALKLALIAWAAANGCDVLEAENDAANVAMLAVNARLGYRPLPDRVLMRSPLPGG